MSFRSPYPPIPNLPDTNAHNFILRRPDQASWTNFPVHIDAKTGETRGFHDFVRRVEWAATALASPVYKGGLGLSAQKGDRVAIMSENAMDYITFVHACLYATIPFVLVSSYAKPFELKHALSLSKPSCLFIDEQFLPMGLPIAEDLGLSSDRVFVMTGSASSARGTGRKSFSQLIDEVRVKKIDIIPARPAKNSTLAYLVFSSGTTGLPKAVMVSHGNIIGIISQLAIMRGAAPESPSPPSVDAPARVLAFLPMYHTYGFVGSCIVSLLAPTTLVIMHKWNMDWGLELIPKYRITTLSIVPSLAHQLVHHPNAAKTDFSSVSVINTGGAYLSPELDKKLFGVIPNSARISEGYALSEGNIVTLSPPPGSLNGKLNSKRGSTGVLAPSVEVRIVRDNGTDAGVNEAGELWVKSPTLTLGYWDNEKATKETFVDGWLKTGDRFRVDEEGYFFFVDRAKDTLKVSGTQVSPVEIENVLLSHPKQLVQDVSVAGVSGGRLSDEKVPRAWVVLSNEGKKLGAAVVVKELEAWHQENLSKYKWLRGGIEVINEIPKSPTGKVLLRVLQEKYEQRLALDVKSKL